MSTYSKQKGREAEREVAELLTEAGFPALRNERNSGGGEDISHSIPGMWLEVKRVERLNLPSALRQAQKAAGGKTPVVIHRASRQPWLVTLPLADLLVIYKAHQTPEEWRPIPGLDGYEASNKGRLRSWRTNQWKAGQPETWVPRLEPRMLKATPSSNGQRRVSISGKAEAVARFVLLAFAGEPPEDKPWALHWNDDPSDNRIENLRWGSPLENTQDRVRNGSIRRTVVPCPHCSGELRLVRLESGELVARVVDALEVKR